MHAVSRHRTNHGAPPRYVEAREVIRDGVRPERTRPLLRRE